MVDYSEPEVRGALERLGQRRWTRLASWSSGRSMKYRHLVGETLGLSDPELAVLAVLMLRGAQTPGELRARTERLHRFDDGELEPLIGGLEERGLVRLLPRRPGQREQRYEQLLGGVDGSRPRPPSPPMCRRLRPRLPMAWASVWTGSRPRWRELREELRALREDLGA